MASSKEAKGMESSKEAKGMVSSKEAKGMEDVCRRRLEYLIRVFVGSPN